MNTKYDIEFNSSKGTYSFVENTKNAISWHRLGQRFSEPLTSAQAIEACNANFNDYARRVYKQRLPHGEGKPHRNINHRGWNNENY